MGEGVSVGRDVGVSAGSGVEVAVGGGVQVAVGEGALVVVGDGTMAIVGVGVSTHPVTTTNTATIANLTRRLLISPPDGVQSEREDTASWPFVKRAAGCRRTERGRQ